MWQNMKKSIVASQYDIAFIGAGNVAWHLAPALENAGHRVVDIYNRSAKNARKLQQRLYRADINPSLDFSHSSATVFFICVSDDAIEDISQEIALPENAIICHTSGAKPANALGWAAAKGTGVFYPLQTFSKVQKISFDDIPILVEGDDKATTAILKRLAGSVSTVVREVSASDRLAIHVAAVFACNFTNYLIGVAADLLADRKLDIELLRPLIAETINKCLDLGPEKAQTGPAARADYQTLDRHMEYLRNSTYSDLYKILTEKILNR